MRQHSSIPQKKNKITEQLRGLQLIPPQREPVP